MNTKIKLAIALAGIFLFASCNNENTTADTVTTDSTNMSNMKMDTSHKKMNDKEMANPDNELANTMKAMMDKMGNMKMTGDFDLDYANMMIGHHQGAIDMSNIELTKGADDKMKTMAKEIITKQTGDITMLRQFVENYKPSGMKHGEGTLQKMQADMKTGMKAMQMNGNTDKDFAAMMISHHEAGMKMSEAQVSNGMSEKLKDMAKKGISYETKEIADFKKWLQGKH